MINLGEIGKEGNLMEAMLGCYTALEGRWSRGRQVEILQTNILVANLYACSIAKSIHFQLTFCFKVYVRGNFYLLATGWKWKIQESTKENDNSAVEVK